MTSFRRDVPVGQQFNYEPVRGFEDHIALKYDNGFSVNDTKTVISKNSKGLLGMSINKGMRWIHMVETMNVGCAIIESFTRPGHDIVELFKGVPVANIDDCMNRTGAVRSDIKPLNSTPLLGTAFTVRVPAGDNLMFHKAMDLARPGDVIVIDADGNVDRAIFGELMTTYCADRGIAGLIIDGAIRDKKQLAAMDFPVYARGVSPNGPYKNGPGEINTVIPFGGIAVFPGCIIVGDADGIVVIRPEDARSIARQARKVMAKEEVIRKGIVSHHVYDRPWVDEKLREIGCEIIRAE